MVLQMSNCEAILGETLVVASGPSPDIVRLLLVNKTDPDVQDSGEGWTALMFAESRYE